MRDGKCWCCADWSSHWGHGLNQKGMCRVEDPEKVLKLRHKAADKLAFHSLSTHQTFNKMYHQSQSNCVDKDKKQILENLTSFFALFLLFFIFHFFFFTWLFSHNTFLILFNIFKYLVIFFSSRFYTFLRFFKKQFDFTYFTIPYLFSIFSKHFST